MRRSRASVLLLLVAGCASPAESGFPSPREALVIESQGQGYVDVTGPGLGPELVFADGASLNANTLTLEEAIDAEPSLAIVRWVGLTPGLVRVDAFGDLFEEYPELAVPDFARDRWVWSPAGVAPAPVVNEDGVLLVAARNPFETSESWHHSLESTVLPLPAWTRAESFPVPEIPEPSGIDWDFRRNKLWVVGDTGVLARVDPASGAVEASIDLGGDYESVRWHPDADRILALDESTGRIRYVSPDLELGLEVTLTMSSALTPAPAAGGDGFEGLALLGGGDLVVANQNDPHALYRGRELGPALIDAHPQPAVNLSEVGLDWGSHRLLTLHGYEIPSTLVLLDEAFQESQSFALDDFGSEGFCFGPDGSLWVALDTGGIARYAP